MSIETQFEKLQLFDEPYSARDFKIELNEIMSYDDFSREALAFDIRSGLLRHVAVSNQSLFAGEAQAKAIQSMKEKLTFCIEVGLRDILTVCALKDHIGLPGPAARILTKEYPEEVLCKFVRFLSPKLDSRQVVSETLVLCLIQNADTNLVRKALDPELMHKYVSLTNRQDLLKYLQPSAKRQYLDNELSL